ncbi:hypothetical protein [Cohnella luojiensis]|uniref:Uncharacterized protein n=1 Tax=Cohnella luojiensis TaxID=652876 RepID=A0A4Y8M5A6_9BACL|nr:hypothetical protein [Cohnella luojiensis]TFE30830.1 hypothetical protein E2980_03370 [Cohnella luojiensis]
MNLSNGIKITKVKAASVTGTTEVLSDVVDMAGYEGVLFFTTIASFNAGNFIKGRQGTNATVTDAADLKGSKVVATADGEVVWLDIYRPQERYVQLSAIRAGVTTVLGDIYALQYESRKQIVDNDVTNTIVGKLLISPDEGAA